MRLSVQVGCRIASRATRARNDYGFLMGGSMQGNIREARLRPEFASLYPGVEPGVWLPATTVG
ncbi:MAG: hypothetical protein ACJ8AM_00400, partial [Gemmatimonadales bacterium]